MLTFAGQPSAATERDLFLWASGSWSPLKSTGPLHSTAEVIALPREFALYPPHPNPSRSATSIRFDLPRASAVSIEIFDVQGRRVETLVKGMRPPGSYDVQWRHGGSGVAPGVYLCSMVAGAFANRRKLVVLP